MARELNIKQLRFIREYVSGKKGSESARIAGYSEATAHKVTAKLLDNPLIAAEIEKARSKLRAATTYDAKAAVVELDEAIEFARKTENATAYMRGIELKAKLHGLLIEKIDQRVSSGFSIQISGIDEQPMKLVGPEPIDVIGHKTDKGGVFE